MARAAHGTFEVKMGILAPGGPAEAAALGRMSLDKVFAGDLSGTSQGEMLAFRTPVDGSAGYVAMERVTGALSGRTGSFVLQHSSTLTRGAPRQSITVVPDSGTDQLTGLSGSMVIVIAGKQHSYEFEYEVNDEG